MKIICDNCATKYSIADEKVRGKVFKIRCKKCSHIIVVRGQEKVEEAPPQEDAAKGFDQKETRVFDYSGFDAGEAGGPAPGAAPAGEVPVWHVVIDREQVGPMTVSEVKERFARGEVDAESYAWREGFEDWIRLASIPDFADLFAGTAAAPNPFAAAAAPAFPDMEAGVFGSSGIGHATAAAADDGGDLFGSPAGAPAYAPEASPVFASSSAPPEPEAQPMFTAPAGGDDEVPLFGRSGGGGGGGMFAAATAGGSLGAVSAQSPRVEVRPLTGQRNENSVLFSLSNLSAIATAGPVAARETPKVGVTSQSETSSGLIDIRSMAQATLSTTSKPADGGAIDDLPSFAPSFSPVAAPVLLPTAEEGMPKWVWPIIGVGGLLVIAIVVMVVMLAGRGKQQIPVGPTAYVVQPGGPTGAPIDPMKGAGPPGASPDGGTAVAMAPAPSGEAKPAVAPGPGGTAPATPDKKEPVKVAVKDTKAPKEHKVKEPKEPKEPKAPKEPREPKVKEPKAAPEPKEAKPGKKDDLDCLLDPNKPGCKGGRRAKEPKEAGPKAEGGGDVKERLEPSDIQKGMRGIKGRVQGCYDQYKVPGMVSVSVTIGSSGRVSSASVTGKFAGTPTGACVAGAVKGAKFDRFKGAALTITYPFVLR
ncbi:MAG: zinc-ribbon domain-containing protein [Deltaproteobacteria bacterium]|nr:zinc-ribbon domain-containing protein [Deltaproteobacteria bacterium]